MSLNINMPSYYTQVYGVDNDIYKMCRLIEKSIDVKRYSDTLDSIGIVPIIAPFEKIECGLYKEVKRISLKSKVATVSIHTDFHSLFSADAEQRKEMIIDNILRSLQYIKRRLGKPFDYEGIEKSILSLSERWNDVYWG